jgi:hypothetical protein
MACKHLQSDIVIEAQRFGDGKDILVRRKERLSDNQCSLDVVYSCEWTKRSLSKKTILNDRAWDVYMPSRDVKERHGNLIVQGEICALICDWFSLQKCWVTTKINFRFVKVGESWICLSIHVFVCEMQAVDVRLSGVWEYSNCLHTLQPVRLACANTISWLLGRVLYSSGAWVYFRNKELSVIWTNHF